MLLHTLQLRRSEKLAVVLVYVVGALSPMASLLRYEFIRKGFGTNPDSSDEFALDEVIKVWTTVEYSTAAIAFCLPSLRGILRRSLVGLVDAVRPRDERFMLENSYVPVVGEDDDEREKIW